MDIITLAIAQNLELPQINETETINIKKLILGVLMAALLLSLYGCGCSDTSGTLDGDMGTADGVLGDQTGNDDGIINDDMLGGGTAGDTAGDLAGDDVIDGDTTDPTGTDMNGGNSAGDSAGDTAQNNNTGDNANTESNGALQ